MTFSHFAIQITVICIIKEGQFRRGMFKQVQTVLYHSRMHALEKNDIRKILRSLCVHTVRCKSNGVCKNDFLQSPSSDFSD